MQGSVPSGPLYGVEHAQQNYLQPWRSPPGSTEQKG